jgi:hypothetical protein
MLLFKTFGLEVRQSHRISKEADKLEGKGEGLGKA